MPDQYRVIISPNALSELEGILDYIALDSPANAVKVIGRSGRKSFPSRPFRDVTQR
jgi:plasmid stabilization system protein ParE